MSYKYGHLAAHAIESVLNQSKPFDVVRFYDDGAGDCDHLPAIYPEVEFILRPDNLGVIDNFNDALNNTTTDRVMFLGADNWLDPHTLEDLSEFNEDIISYHGTKILEGDDTYWEVNQAHGSSLYNVGLAKEVGGYEASGNEHAEEDSMLFNKMLKTGATLTVVDIPYIYYRWRHRRNFNQ
jgi:glycosyltransferase involved in cell wall biosynthesis